MRALPLSESEYRSLARLVAEARPKDGCALAQAALRNATARSPAASPRAQRRRAAA